MRHIKTLTFVLSSALLWSCEPGATDVGETLSTGDTAATSGTGTTTGGDDATSTSGSTGGSTDTGATETTGADSCDCFSLPEQSCSVELLEASVPGCTAERSCPDIHGECPGEHPDNCDSLEPGCALDLDWSGGIDCALQALADGVPTIVTVDDERYGEDLCSFYGPSRQRWWIRADGSVVVARCTKSDAGVIGEGGQVHQAADPSHFGTCLAMSTDNDKYACLRAGLPMGDDLPACEP